MPRCASRPRPAPARPLPLRRALLTTAAGCILCLQAAPVALAQAMRPFPATALRGQLEVTQPPAVLLNGQPARLSPSTRIRGADNLFKVSGALIGQTLTVHYTLEPNGAVHNIWVLTPAEAARQPWPSTLAQAQRWQFDPIAQAWTQR